MMKMINMKIINVFGKLMNQNSKKKQKKNFMEIKAIVMKILNFIQK